MSHPPEPPPSGPAYGGGYGPPPAAGMVAPTNGKATASLITGIASLVLSWCCGLGLVGIAAIVLGVQARSEIRASEGRQQGDGLARAGIITGSIAVLLGVAVLVLIVIAMVAGLRYDFSLNTVTSGA